MSNFARTLDLLHRGMDVAMLRDSVYANNYANADVPNFKRSEVNFEAELAKAINSQDRKPAFEMARSDPVHITSDITLDYRKVEPRRVLDYLSTYNNNGNNVDPEVEQTKLLKNQMMYSLMAQAASFEFGQVSLVLRA